MNRPITLSDLIRKAATATVVQKPVLKKKKRTAAKDAKPVPDAIYGVKDAELQAIWDKHQAQKRKPLPKKVTVNQPPRKMYRPVQYRPTKLPGILAHRPAKPAVQGRGLIDFKLKQPV